MEIESPSTAVEDCRSFEEERRWFEEWLLGEKAVAWRRDGVHGRRLADRTGADRLELHVLIRADDIEEGTVVMAPVAMAAFPETVPFAVHSDPTRRRELRYYRIDGACCADGRRAKSDRGFVNGGYGRDLVDNVSLFAAHLLGHDQYGRGRGSPFDEVDGRRRGGRKGTVASIDETCATRIVAWAPGDPEVDARRDMVERTLAERFVVSGDKVLLRVSAPVWEVTCGPRNVVEIRSSEPVGSVAGMGPEPVSFPLRRLDMARAFADEAAASIPGGKVREIVDVELAADDGTAPIEPSFDVRPVLLGLAKLVRKSLGGLPVGARQAASDMVELSESPFDDAWRKTWTRLSAALGDTAPAVVGGSVPALRRQMTRLHFLRTALDFVVDAERRTEIHLRAVAERIEAAMVAAPFDVTEVRRALEGMHEFVPLGGAIFMRALIDAIQAFDVFEASRSREALVNCSQKLTLLFWVPPEDFEDGEACARWGMGPRRVIGVAGGGVARSDGT